MSSGPQSSSFSLMVAAFVQQLRYQREMKPSVDRLADALRHDQYSQEMPQKAICSDNDHIESCNRVIEAEEAGIWTWTSTAELAELHERLETAESEVKRLSAGLGIKSALIAEMSQRCALTCVFRGKPSTCSDRSRPLIPIQVDQ